jgi:NNP family nitrate/nitrite transporter-like MFS transporter
VFQLVPQRFPREIGVTTGIVGAAGGVGGFLLPTVLGSLRQLTGSFSGGFLAFAVVGGLGGAMAIAYASRGWRGIFINEDGKAAEIAPVPVLVLAEAQGVA